MSNVVLTLLVASQVTPEAFGAYAITIGLYTLALGAEQALVGEPLLVLHGGGSCDTQIAGRAAAAAVQLGAAGAVVLLVSSRVIRGELRTDLVILAVALPALMLQDALRFIAFARREPGRALVNDVVWAVVQVAATSLVLRRDSPRAAELVVAWASGALLAAFASAVACRVKPTSVRSLHWYAETRRLSVRYLAEALSVVGAFQLVSVLLGALAGISAAGALRLGQVVFGPVHVLFTGARTFLTPRFVSDLAAGIPIRKATRAAMIALTLVASGVFLALWLPPAARVAGILGPTWGTARQVLPLIYAQKLAECLGFSSFVALRAQQRAQETFTVSYRSALLTAVLAAPAIHLFGIAGAAGALALSSVVSMCVFVSKTRIRSRSPLKAAGRGCEADRSVARLAPEEVERPGA